MVGKINKIMSNKIIEIREKVPKETTLPDGKYIGTWGGYIIDVRYNDKTYELKTEQGVRGVNIRVVVTIENGEATFQEINN
jgi:hypothetical protein